MDIRILDKVAINPSGIQACKLACSSGHLESCGQKYGHPYLGQSCNQSERYSSLQACMFFWSSGVLWPKVWTSVSWTKLQSIRAVFKPASLHVLLVIWSLVAKSMDIRILDKVAINPSGIQACKLACSSGHLGSCGQKYGHPYLGQSCYQSERYSSLQACMFFWSSAPMVNCGLADLLWKCAASWTCACACAPWFWSSFRWAARCPFGMEVSSMKCWAALLRLTSTPGLSISVSHSRGATLAMVTATRRAVITNTCMVVGG